MRNLPPLVTYRPTLQRFCKLPRPWPLTLTRLSTAVVARSAPGDVPSTVRPTTARYWTTEETDDLKRMDRNKVPLRHIAESLGRTVQSIRNRLSKIQRGVPLSTSQSKMSYSMRRWTADEANWAVRLKEEGHFPSQIAKVLNRTRMSVHHRLSIESRNISKGSLTFQEWEVLQKMKSDGATCYTIARSLNRHTGTVRHWMGRQHFEGPGKVPYTATEDRKLRELVEKATPWREIRRLMPNRTVSSMEKRYHRDLKHSASRIKPTPWKTDEIETLKELAQAGRGHIEIASRLNRSVLDVSRRIGNELGLRRRDSAKWSSEELALLKSMRAEGHSYKVIAAKIGKRTAIACSKAHQRHYINNS